MAIVIESTSLCALCCKRGDLGMECGGRFWHGTNVPVKVNPAPLPHVALWVLTAFGLSDHAENSDNSTVILSQIIVNLILKL